MLNRKLLEVLGCLNFEEKKRLQQFLKSPYFNNAWNADDVVRLYELIVGYDADEKHPSLSKEAIFRVFFPNRQYREKEKSPLDSLASDLFRLVQHFLEQQEMEQQASTLSRHLALAKFYRKFAFEERFWHTIKVMRQVQEKALLRDARYFFNQFLLEEEEFTFRVLHNSFEDDVNLTAVHFNLDLYYSILKLDYACALVYQQQVAQVEGLPPTSLIESVMELTKEDSLLDSAINRIYRLVIEVLRASEPADEKLRLLENWLDRYQSQIPDDKFKNIKAYIRFASLREYRKSGNVSYMHHAFGIYQQHLKEGYLYVENQIPLVIFRNMVVFGLKLREFDWVKSFLDAHPPERICSTRYPAEVHSLNLAEYYFYLKNYEESQQHLVYRLFENPTVGILADLLLVKIYFETKDELLEVKMKALEQKIRRTKLNQQTKNRYMNFLKKLHKIIRYGWEKKSPKRERLIVEIKNTPEIVAREWLLEQLA